MGKSLFTRMNRTSQSWRQIYNGYANEKVRIRSTTFNEAVFRTAMAHSLAFSSHPHLNFLSPVLSVSPQTRRSTKLASRDG